MSIKNLLLIFQVIYTSGMMVGCNSKVSNSNKVIPTNNLDSKESVSINPRLMDSVFVFSREIKEWKLMDVRPIFTITMTNKDTGLFVDISVSSVFPEILDTSVIKGMLFINMFNLFIVDFTDGMAGSIGVYDSNALNIDTLDNWILPHLESQHFEQGIIANDHFKNFAW